MEDFITALTAKATTMAADVATCAGAALAILGVFYGIRLAVRAFKMVK